MNIIMSRIFSVQDRQDVYDYILSDTRECGSIIALVQVGSGVKGFRDERSDLDYIIALDSQESILAPYRNILSQSPEKSE